MYGNSHVCNSLPKVQQLAIKWFNRSARKRSTDCAANVGDLYIAEYTKLRFEKMDNMKETASVPTTNKKN